MLILLFAHPQLSAFMPQDVDCFCTQNPEELLRWSKRNKSGIIVIDLDAYDVESWTFLPSHVYIGFSSQVSTLSLAKKRGIQFVLSKQTSFREMLNITIQNAQEHISLEQKNQDLREIITQKKADQDISLLLGGISHDFNNILSIVLGSAKVLQYSSELSPVQEELVKSIIEATNHGKDLSKQLMQYQNKTLESCEINTVLHRIGSLIQKSLPGNITLSLSKAPSRKINISAADLIRILMNLIINARDAMPTGGDISIRVHELPAFVQIEVEDNGQGMTQEVQARIFEPFYTTKEKQGTGLGLAGVQSIIKKKKGRISCSSIVQKGTTFLIELPYWKAPEVFILDSDPQRAQHLHKIVISKGKTSVLCQSIADLIQKIQQAPLGTIIVSESFSSSFPFEMFLRQYLILCGKAKDDDLWNLVLPSKSTAETIFQAFPK